MNFHGHNLEGARQGGMGPIYNNDITHISGISHISQPHITSLHYKVRSRCSWPTLSEVR